MDARDAGDWSSFELTVVELLCADPRAMGDSPALQASTTWSDGVPLTVEGGGSGEFLG